MRVQSVSPNQADRLDPLQRRRDSVSSLLSPLDAGGPGWGGSGRMRGRTALARDAEPDARGPSWGATSGCGEVQATGAGGR